MHADPAAQIRKDCWDQAIHTYGTAHVFECRARRLRRWLDVLAFAAIAIPLVVGAAVMSFPVSELSLPALLAGAAVLGILQLVCFTWSIVAKWQDAYAYAVQSASANHRLSSNLQDLGKHPPTSLDELRARFELLQADNRNRADQDLGQGITDKEKRLAHRAGLRQIQRACAACGKIPNSLESSDCPVCGRF